MPCCGNGTGPVPAVPRTPVIFRGYIGLRGIAVVYPEGRGIFSGGQAFCSGFPDGDAVNVIKRLEVFYAGGYLASVGCMCVVEGQLLCFLKPVRRDLAQVRTGMVYDNSAGLRRRVSSLAMPR